MLIQPKVAPDQSVKALGPLVMYCVNLSYPYSSNGYAVRTHGVAKGLVANGYDVIVVNRPGRPWDLPDTGEYNNTELDLCVDGIRYLFLPYPSRRFVNKQLNWKQEAENSLHQLMQVFKPDIILGASNWENAELSCQAAKRAAIPFYYEVRGFWELSRASRDPAYGQSTQFSYEHTKEAEVANNATHVFTLNRAMAAELTQRGVDATKISVVPNCCIDIPAVPESEHVKRPFTIGYIGSFSEYEGLDDLVQACAMLKTQVGEIRLMLVGSSQREGLSSGEGTIERRLKTLAEKVNLTKEFELYDRVPGTEIAGFYHNIDVVVNPRRSFLVTELVSALKPVEAASYGKVVLLSSVKPNLELAEQCKIFHLFEEGSIESLVAQLNKIYTTDGVLQQAKLIGPAWVKKNRLFKHAVQVMIDKFNSRLSTLC
ncbi:glycosyltransferase [Rheinheimera baltica]|uniref:Glycosyltransferase n=1 Tax=Rheinheimera baltica TaxID=67576 RepID=A0ABT9HV12_9GAMM|nr:glycosyltransferase [Rheinheimera baltica]MDP5134967.1 glycosyltransferase [Rheinheimera baltica]